MRYKLTENRMKYAVHEPFFGMYDKMVSYQLNFLVTCFFYSVAENSLD